MDKISVNKLKNKHNQKDSFILLDVRTDSEVAKTKIPIDSIHIPMNKISVELRKLNKNDTIIVYCKSGIRSKKVCEFLISNNFQNVKNLEGGILAWAQKIEPAMLIDLI